MGNRGGLGWALSELLLPLVPDRVLAPLGGDAGGEVRRILIGGVPRLPFPPGLDVDGIFMLFGVVGPKRGDTDQRLELRSALLGAGPAAPLAGLLYACSPDFSRGC